MQKGLDMDMIDAVQIEKGVSDQIFAMSPIKLSNNNKKATNNQRLSMNSERMFSPKHNKEKLMQYLSSNFQNETMFNTVDDSR